MLFAPLVHSCSCGSGERLPHGRVTFARGLIQNLLPTAVRKVIGRDSQIYRVALVLYHSAFPTKRYRAPRFSPCRSTVPAAIRSEIAAFHWPSVIPVAVRTSALAYQPGRVRRKSRIAVVGVVTLTVVAVPLSKSSEG